MIKLGQLGMGHGHAAAKLASARKFPERFTVIGVCENDAAVRKRCGSHAAYAGVPFLSEEELLSSCDAVLVEESVPRLNDAARRALAAGCHIHLDKPGCEDLTAFKAMLDEAQRKHLTVQLGYMYRYNPSVQRCLALYRSGELGEILSITAEMSTYHSTEYVRSLERYAGGTFYIFGSHLIDLTCLFLGEPQRVTSFFKQTGIDGLACADNDLCVLEYGKALAKLYTSSHECNGWGRRQFTVCGTRRTVEIRPLEVPARMTVATHGDGGEYFDDYARRVEVPTVPDDCRYDAMLMDFYRFVTGEAENPYTYDYEYRVQRTLLRACKGECL